MDQPQIGRALAIQLIAREATVLVCVRRQEKLDAFQTKFPQVHTVQANINCKRDRQKIWKIARQWGGADLLINNTTVFATHLNPGEPIAPSKVEAMVQTNVAAPVILTPHFVQQLPEGLNGAILDMGSLAAWREIPEQAIYPSPKAAPHAFTTSM